MGISIVYGSEKGGVGKTTTTANTAAMLLNKGKSVGILKSDKNDDMMNWSTIARLTACRSFLCMRHTAI